MISVVRIIKRGYIMRIRYKDGKFAGMTGKAILGAEMCEFDHLLIFHTDGTEEVVALEDVIWEEE